MTNLVNYEKVKYQFEKNTVVPGTYTLHRPSQCNLKFPKDNRPIHKKLKNAYEGKETIELLQNSKWRHMLLPNKEKTLYPAISHKNQYQKLEKYTIPVEETEDKKFDTDLRQKAAEESEKLKAEFKAKQKPQPGIKKEHTEDRSEEDAKTITKNRAYDIYNENFQGARIANQFILASKCHAIRDAQVAEKAIISQQLVEEDKRLDEIMEKARVAALEEERIKYEEKKARRLENINIIKQQIDEHEKARTLEMERISKETTRLNRAGLAIFKDEAEKLKEKRENALRLMELLNKCNEELIQNKQKQMEEDKIMEGRILRFRKERQEREIKLKIEAKKKNIARERNINFIASAQESAKKYREEMENIRVLKVQEDVEREYREKEKALTIKKIKELKMLKEAREKQIADIRRQIAMEISRDEEVFKNIIKRNEENAIKEEEKLKTRQEALKNHRQYIIKQINEKERKRIEMRKLANEEGIAMKLELERQENLEKDVVRRKVEEMKEQKIPEIYVNEVKQRLTKLKYY
ncbi:cilia- and flagella-associated protein 45-like [Arctopsyche grandis]|uniref:cilia- and flagella-associated protein 45-like n=1 Tax=Arctopsyche grandis TaxID=121162 RepID=UPI00406D649C